MKKYTKPFVLISLSLALGARAQTAPAPAPDAAPAPAPANTAAPEQAAPSAPAATNAATPAISSEYSSEGLRMNFHGAPLNLVLDYLSDAAGFIINKQTDVRGTVEVWSKQPVTKDEAIELLSSVLKKNGYAVTRSGRILTIVAMDSVKTADTAIVVNTDPNEVEKSDEVQTQIIPVRYATASQLVANLEQLLPTSASLTANESANSLILVATKTDIKRMLTIVTALDNSMAGASNIKVRPLRFADAKETANLITQLYSQQSNQNGQNTGGGPNFGGGPGGGFRAMMAQMTTAASRGGRNSVAARVVAVADDRSNSVVISAPPDLLTAIDDMIDKIDQQITDTTELRVFRLANADPAELADQLSQLFPDETNSNNNNQNNNVPFFFRGRGGFPGQANTTQSSDRMKKLGKVLAVADPRTASLIVTASKSLMPQIAEMISELDSDKGKREVVSYYELQNADPQDVYQNLQDLFNRSTVRMQNNNNQNTFLGRNNPLTVRQTQNQQSTTGNNTAGGLGTGGALGGGAGRSLVP
ncbi:MAG TPA: secretin N-terminal domain-containing protein [Verrucomicrobiae bacterium]|nr:secretin N-terminal domain-containing protein [Verrucomicrobiae bacterium]